MRQNTETYSSVIGVIRANALAIATLTAITILNGVNMSVQAAQTLVLRRGSSTATIQLADLKTFAETGIVSPSLEQAARVLTPEQRRQIQTVLKTKYKIDATTASNFLNTEFGNNLSYTLANVTSQPDRDGMLAVRTAIIQGARVPEGLSVISFIEAYPNPRLDIDLEQAFRVVRNFNTAFWQTQAFMEAIAPQLAPKHPTLDLPFDPTQPGSANVKVLNLNLKDQQRRREISVDLYWSTTASANKSLVVFSHGLGSIRTDLRYLAEHLASHGYIVAALEHPGSNETHVREALAAKTPLLEAEEFLNRPKDISFVLDQLQKLNQSPSGPFAGKLATDRVMVVGYSFGGSTALSLAGAEMQLTQLKQRCPGNVLAFSLGENAQCFARELPNNRYQLRDPRIKAAIALSPTTSLLFGETGLTKVAVPTLITSGSADKTTPALTEQVVAFDQMPSPKWLVGFIGGTHLSVKDPSTTKDQAGQPDTLYSGGEIVGDQAVEVRNYVKAIALAMAAQLTDEAAKYAIFLTPEYAQLASTKRFPIRLVTNIPPEAEAIVKEFVQNQANQNSMPSTRPKELLF